MLNFPLKNLGRKGSWVGILVSVLWGLESLASCRKCLQEQYRMVQCLPEGMALEAQVSLDQRAAAQRRVQRWGAVV